MPKRSELKREALKWIWANFDGEIQSLQVY